ncbi:MAG: M13 family metallopeptidase [Pirellulales bacterium]|nr:M13 family metallopeptidase [Pirellulales bacterium]
MGSLAVFGLAAMTLANTLGSGIDRKAFDTSVKPGDDFFQYVNGTWIAHHPIPSEFSRWGAFHQLRDSTTLALRDILEALVADSGKLDPERRKLRDFYRTAMNEEKIEQQGLKPLAGELQRIEHIDSIEGLGNALASFQAEGISLLFHLGVSPDEKDSTHYAVDLMQGGLGLPERDYYLGDKDDLKKIREKYREHVARMFQLLGDSDLDAKKHASTVVEIETKLAEASRTPTQLRDRESQYNKKTIAELSALAPSIDWLKYLQIVGLSQAKEIIVGQPEFFQRVNILLTSAPIEDWQTYLRWHLIRSTAPFLSSPFEEEHFRFYSGELRGVKEMQPRFKRVIATIDGEMGEALGKLYVEKHFQPAAKRRMDQLVKNLIDAFRQRLATRDWMGDETKKQALDKLAKIAPKIGYPEKWRDYSDLEVVADSYVQNVLRAEAFDTRYRFSKLGKTVDREEWHTTPQTVNAFYSSTQNEITFPAGILQPPFFNPTADDAVNYGAIGAVIGHEITHGFDDQGSQSDGDGNLRNWWTEADRGRFMALANKLVKQYDDCLAIDDLHVNGRLTLGENIADLGGVSIAYAAYQDSLGGKEAPVIDGFTGPQRFFIGFAQVWRGSDRDAELRLMIRTNPHSPGKFRTLVPLSNFGPFYDAFDIEPGDKWYRKPEERVQIW